jgi:S1-C subfamily serine protease
MIKNLFILRKKMFHKKMSLPYLSILLLLWLSTTASAQQSVIGKIHLIMPSIVGVHARGTVLFKGPQSNMIDPSSGQLVNIKGLKAAEINNSGSGVIIDPQGIIVTNAHIIAHAGQIAVMLHDKTTVGAKVLSVIDGQDLAFLKIDPPYPLTKVDFTPSSSIQLGDEVVTVGSSPSLQQTISAGRIVGIGQSLSQKSQNQAAMLKVSINIYHGDSGGPLFNQKGQLAGLMVASQLKLDRSSFAIPSDIILKHYKDLLISWQQNH